MRKLYNIFKNGSKYGHQELTPEQVKRYTADGWTVIRA